jgi:hypothetical protein
MRLCIIMATTSKDLQKESQRCSSEVVKMSVEKKAVPTPGRTMSFEQALETTLREDKELLRRLAQ